MPVERVLNLVISASPVKHHSPCRILIFSKSLASCKLLSKLFLWISLVSWVILEMKFQNSWAQYREKMDSIKRNGISERYNLIQKKELFRK